jgi:PAS domain S-box-containing protein
MPTDQHAPAGPLLLDVDDTEANRYWRSRVLRRAGFELIEAATGADGIRLSETRRPALVLLDVNLPDLDGLDVCRRIKAGPQPAPMVLLVSALSTDTGARVAGLDAGADAYLLAPSEPAELLAQVRALLRLHAAEEAARRAEDATRESEARFRTLADNIAQFAWMADERGSIFWYNRRWFDYTGTTLEEMQGWGWRAVHHPEHVERVVQKFAQHIDSGEAWEDTFPLRGHDGQYRWFLSRAMPIRDAGGRVLRWFGTNTDVTDQKRAEEQVRVTLESIGDGFFALDDGWRFTYVNAAAERLLGVPRDGLIGRTIWEAFAPARGTFVEQEYRRAAAGETVDFEYLYEPWQRWFHNRCFPREGGGITVYFRDITRRKHAETEREAMLAENARLFEEAQEANKLKDEFLATLSHELRTPLNAILGWTVLLKGSRLDAASEQRALETIERNARAQAELISDILDVSRIVAGKLSLNPADLDVGPVVEQVVDALRPAATEQQIDLRVAPRASCALVHADPARLQQVVWNLVSNAVKFSARGGRIEVTTTATDDAVLIAVRDEGIGITPEFLPHVFDRFRQADGSSTRAHAGIGLGLAIAKDLVEMHDGTIVAESPGRNRGSTFTVRLPRVHAPARNDEVPAPLERAALPLSVLVVDDHRDTREMMELTLADERLCVKTAASSDAALEAYVSQRCDVALIDISMPGQDGYACLRELRAQAERLGRPLAAIAVTAAAREQDRQRALEAGFDAHVAKPVDRAALVTVIHAVTRRVRETS